MKTKVNNEQFEEKHDHNTDTYGSNLILSRALDQCFILSLDPDLPRSTPVGTIFDAPIIITPVKTFESDATGKTIVKVALRVPDSIRISKDTHMLSPKDYDIKTALDSLENPPEFDDLIEAYDFWASRELLLNDLFLKVKAEINRYHMAGARHKTHPLNMEYLALLEERVNLDYELSQTKREAKLAEYTLKKESMEPQNYFTNKLIETLQDELSSEDLERILSETKSKVAKVMEDQKGDYDLLVERIDQITKLKNKK